MSGNTLVNVSFPAENQTFKPKQSKNRTETVEKALKTSENRKIHKSSTKKKLQKMIRKQVKRGKNRPKSVEFFNTFLQLEG